MIELIITGLLSAASFTVPTLLWFSDRSKQAESRVDEIEKQLQRIELEGKFTKELIETRFSASLDRVSSELVDLQINVKALHRRLDELGVCKRESN